MSAATASALATYPKFKAFDPSTGGPLSGGKLSTFVAGTSTPLATYSDPGLTVQNSNPVVLDSNGEAVIYAPPAGYKFVLTDALNNTLWTVDQVYPAGAPVTGINVAMAFADISAGFNVKTQLFTNNVTIAPDLLSEFSSGQVTIKNKGIYAIELSCLSKDTAAAVNQIATIQIGGVDYAVGQQPTAVAGQPQRTSVRVVTAINAGTLIKFFFQGSANTTLFAVGGTGSIQTYFNVARVA